MGSNLLKMLQGERTKQRAVIARATRELEVLETAIATLVGKQNTPATLAQAPEAKQLVAKPRRGEVMRVALDCIRTGRGTPAEIRQECIERGVKITGNSVSNVLQRLKLTIQWQVEEKRYVMRDSEEVATANRARLRHNLQDSLQAEGSKVVTMKPSSSNGAAVQPAQHLGGGPVLR